MVENSLDNIGGGIDSGEIREDQNKITEQDRQQIQDNTKKAKKIQKQIQTSKQENNKIANFLSFILQNIQEEKIVNGIYHTFFKTQNPDDQKIYLRKNANSLVLIGFFAPFYQIELKKFKIKNYFDEFNIENITDFGMYLKYLVDLSSKYHDNIPIIQESLIDLIYDILNYYKLTPPGLKEEEIKPLIIRDLY